MASEVTSSNPLIAAAEERTRAYVPRVTALLERGATYATTDVVLKPASEGGPPTEIYRGKVRDLYRHPAHPDHLLMVATDPVVYTQTHQQR